MMVAYEKSKGHEEGHKEGHKDVEGVGGRRESKVILETFAKKRCKVISLNFWQPEDSCFGIPDGHLRHWLLARIGLVSWRSGGDGRG